MRLPILPGLAALSIALMASGCTTVGGSGKAFLPETTSYAYLPNATQTQLLLRGIPKPSRQVAVAVYSFTDQTGQFKPSATGQTLSNRNGNERGARPSPTWWSGSWPPTRRLPLRRHRG